MDNSETTEKKNIFSKILNWFKNEKKSIKIICVIVFIIIILDIILGIVLLNRKNNSQLRIKSLGNIQFTEKVNFEEKDYDYVIKQKTYKKYKFSEEEKKEIKKIYQENNSCALISRFTLVQSGLQEKEFDNEESIKLHFGFLTKQDFSKKKENLEKEKIKNNKITVSVDLQKIDGLFDISIAFPKGTDFNENFPEGFFVYSDLNCKIENVYIAPAELGFDCSNKVPFFGFSCNGGIIDSSFSSVDFSNASFVFPVENTKEQQMPEIILKFSDNENCKSSKGNLINTVIYAGGEQLKIRNVESAKQIAIPSSALKNPFILFDIAENKECISAILMRAENNNRNLLFERTETEVFTPIKTDPGLILQYPKENWRVRDYEIFEWDRNPGILFFDIRNYDIQDNFFRRLAYFVEKAGYKGRILSDAELKGKHGYNAHDYSPESLAAFFNKVDEINFKLNKEEETLRKILLQNGLIIDKDGVILPGKGGLVSISQESADYLRKQLLAHEGWHTIYFADAEFRNFVAAVYYMMDDKTRDFLIDYFKSQSSLGYDVTDDYLMKNEFMAYLMQQGINSVANYFVTHAKWDSVMSYTPDLARYIIRTNGQGFEDAAVLLNDYVFDKYGIICGNISLVNK